MKKFIAAVSFPSLLLWMVAIGCSSKQDDEIALAPMQASPDASSQPDPSTDPGSSDDGSSDDGSMDTGSSDDGSSDDDGSNDFGTTDDDSSDDGSMVADDGSMPEDDGSGTMMIPAKPKNLREQAEQAFGDGYEKAAYRLIQAHLLASSTDTAELLSHYRWSPARRQPQLGARIAVGVFLTSPPSERGDYKPIGSLRGFFSSRKGSTRNRNFDAGDGNDPVEGGTPTLHPTNDKERILQKYTGLMGDVLVNHFKNAHGQGKWSPVFQTIPGVAITPTTQPFNGDESGGDDPSGTDDSGDGQMMAPARAELATKLVGDEEKYVSVGPTLTFIGLGSSAELIDKAKSGAFDALVVYEVVVTLNLRARIIYNECKAKLLNLADGKALAMSKLLKNTESQKEIDKSGIAFVESAMQPVLTKLDELTSLTELPAVLTPEIIKAKRLPVLISDTSRSKLETLSEIRLYREKSLLDDADVATAYEAILGAEDGKLLATGTEDERLVVVKKLLASP